MGKLSDLWGELKVAKSESEKTEIKKKINDIEAWCIEKGFGGIKEQTDWNKPMKSKKKDKDTFRTFSFTEEAGFVTIGNFILPQHKFCKCGLYKDNVLISVNGGFITWSKT
jgi:hypothetical protein